MVARDILLAELTGARFHVAHVSTRNSVAMVAHARSRGLPVSAEATPHHIALADAMMPPYDSSYRMKPPLRSASDVEAVRACIVAGAIEAIASDHAPHPGSEKMQEFEKCPFGVIGLETALAIVLETLVHTGRIGLARFVELFTTGPARLLGLGRGRLSAGAPADVTIFDPERSWTYDVNKSYSKSRNTPFDGRTFRGGPVATIVNGRFVWRADRA
jgi:dihydroorotase